MNYQDDRWGDGCQIDLDPSSQPTERWEDIQARAIRAEKARAEAEAMEHARAGGECLLLAASYRQEWQWLPGQKPCTLDQECIEANLAARWVVANIKTGWRQAELFDLVCRYYVGDTKGMSGGKRGLKADIADWLRQYEQGFVDPVEIDDDGTVVKKTVYKTAPAPENNPFAALEEMMK